MAHPVPADLNARLQIDGVLAADMPGDILLQALIDSAKTAVNGFCKRDFEAHTAQEITMEGNGTARYLLPYYPLTKISDVTVDGDDITAAQLAEVTLLTHGVVVLPFSVAKDVPVVFTVDHGYAAAAVPAVVKEAELILASRMYRHRSARERVAEGVTREDVGDYQVQFEAQEMDKDVAAMLQGGGCVKKR
jgi:hypothetical protein